MNEDEKKMDPAVRKRLLMLGVLFLMLSAPIAVNFVQAVDKANEPRKEWPQPTITGEDEQYTYYELTVAHPKYNDAVEYIEKVGGEITSETNKVRDWWTVFEYKVEKVTE